MNLNVKNVTSKLLLLMGLMLTFSFVSCSNDEDESELKSTEEVVKEFKSIFLKQGELPQFSNAKQGYYFAVVENGERSCQLFTQMTGEIVPQGQTYSKKYDFGNGYYILVEGARELEGDKILYATFYVKLPGISDISVIELYSEAIKNSENGAGHTIPRV